MPELNTEEKLEQIFKGITTVQETVNDNEKALSDRLDKTDQRLDAIDQEKVEKISAAVTKSMEDMGLEKSKAKFDEIEERQKAAEQALIEMRRGEGGEDNSQFLKDYQKSVQKYLRKGTLLDSASVEGITRDYIAKNTFGVDDAEIEMMTKAMVAGSGPEGGYFITPDRSNRIVQRIFETSPVRGLATIETTSSDVWEVMLDDDEADAGVVGEVDPRNDTDTPQIGMVKIPIHEYYAQPKATQKMVDDAGFDIEGWLTRKVSTRIGRLENTDFVTGNSSLRPKGFLSYAASADPEVYERGTVGQVDSGVSAEISADNVIALQNTLIEDYQARASWGMNRKTFTTIMQLKTEDGFYLLNPAILREGATKIMLGNEVTFMSDIPVVAADSLALVIADWAEFYTIVDRFDIRVLRDPYTAKPYIKYYTTKRTGAAVTNFEAAKILKLSA